MLEDVLGDLRIQGAEGRVEDRTRGPRVETARDCESLPLTAAEEDAAFADLRLVTFGQHVQVGGQIAREDDFIVPFLLKRPT